MPNQQTECVYCKHPLPFEFKDSCPNCGNDEPLIKRIISEENVKGEDNISVGEKKGINDEGQGADAVKVINNVSVNDEGHGKEARIDIVKTFTVKNWYYVAIILIITYLSPLLFYFAPYLAIGPYISGVFGLVETYALNTITLILGLYMIVRVIEKSSTRFE